jgi:predicted dehydrogenase
MNKTYRVALIGCGGRGRVHVPGIVADSRLQLIALADANAANAEAVNEEHKLGAAIYTDYHQLLEHEKPDIVVACLWTELHLAVIRDCAQAGVKAILSEKPMAATWGECLEIAQIAQETGCQLSFTHQRRFAKGNQFVRQLIADGTLGEIKRMDLTSPPHLLDCGTHTFDQALSFLGETPARWVLGAVDTSKVISFFNVRAEATAVGTVVFENGVRANFQFGGPNLDQWSGVRVIGTGGFISVLWGGEIQEYAIYDQPTWQPPTLEDGDNDHMIGLLRNVADCVESGAEPETSWQKALRAAEIIFALYESVRQCARIELPLTGVTDNPLHALLDGDHVRVTPESKTTGVQA